MTSRIRIHFAFLITLAAIVGCSDSVEVPTPEDSREPDYGSMPTWFGTGSSDTTGISKSQLQDPEAAWMTLWLTSDLVAPQEPYERLLRDITAIRDQYSELDPPLKGVFRRYWNPSILRVGLTADAVDQYLDGTYADLDSLNSLFGLETVLENFLEPGEPGSITLIFRGRLHPARLAEFYEQVDTVRYTAIAWWAGDGHRIYPWYADGKLTYLFREGQGDCLAGCTMNRYWYFRTDSEGNIDFVGGYTAWQDDREPAWWPEAARNRHEFDDGELE